MPNEPNNQVISLHNSSVQESLLLSSKRLQLFAYVLAELSSAATLLEDHVRASQRIPERLAAAWQTLAVGAAWRTTLDHTIRLYATQKVKRWYRRHLRRRRQQRRRRHGAGAKSTPARRHDDVKPENYPPSPSHTTPFVKESGDAVQRRLSTSVSHRSPQWHRPQPISRPRGVDDDPSRAPTASTHLSPRIEEVDTAQAGDASCVELSTRARRPSTHNTPLRFPTPASTSHALSGASFSVNRKGSGYVRRVTPLAHARAGTSTTSTTTSASGPSGLSSPLANANRADAVPPHHNKVPSPRGLWTDAAHQIPYRAERKSSTSPHRRHKPFSWSTDAIHPKLSRLFLLCTSGEDELGYRIESLREVLVGALFKQFLDVDVHSSANDLVLYRWLDRRRYLTFAQERRFEVALVARAEHASAQRLLGKQRRKSRAQQAKKGGVAVTGAHGRDDACASVSSREIDAALRRQRDVGLMLPTPVEVVDEASECVAKETTTARPSTFPSLSSSWRSRKRPVLTQPSTERARTQTEPTNAGDAIANGGKTLLASPRSRDGLVRDWSMTFKEEDELASPSQRFSLSHTTPHTPFSYHSAAVAMPEAVYRRASATRDGHRGSETEAPDWQHATPTSQRSSRTHRRRRIDPLDEKAEEDLMGRSGSTTTDSFMSPRNPSRTTHGNFAAEEEAGEPGVAAPGTLRMVSTASSGVFEMAANREDELDEDREDEENLFEAPRGHWRRTRLASLSPPALPQKAFRSPSMPQQMPCDDVQNAHEPRTSSPPHKAIAGRASDEENTSAAPPRVRVSESQSGSDDDESLLNCLLRDAPLPLHLSASAAETVLLEVTPMPMRLFMRAATTFSPTICAFSLLSRCVIYASHVRNSEEESSKAADAAYARFLERERPLDTSSATAGGLGRGTTPLSPRLWSSTAAAGMANAVPQHYHLVIANREVGHCEHAIPCFGNRKFIFVPCADADALVQSDNGDDEETDVEQGHYAANEAAASDSSVQDPSMHNAGTTGHTASSDPHSPSPNATFEPVSRVVDQPDVNAHSPSPTGTFASSPAGSGMYVQDVSSPIMASTGASFSLLTPGQRGSTDGLHTHHTGPASPSACASGLRSCPSSRRRGRRRSSTLFPVSTGNMRERLLSLGDQLPASVHPSPEPAAVTEDSEDDTTKHEEEREDDDVETYANNTHATRETRHKPATISFDGENEPERHHFPDFTTEAPPSRARGGGSGGGHSARSRPPISPSSHFTPVPGGAPAVLSLSSPSTTVRKAGQLPLAPPPFMQLATSVPSVAMPHRQKSATTTTATTRSFAQTPVSSLSSSPSSVVSPASSAGARPLLSPVRRRAFGPILPSAEQKQVPTHHIVTDEEHVAMASNAVGGNHNTDAGAHTCADEEYEESGEEEEEEEEALFFVMYARYCSAPAETNAPPRPALMSAASSPSAFSAATTSDLGGPSLSKPLTSQQAHLTHALASLKRAHDSAAVTSTLPTMTGMPPPPPRHAAAARTPVMAAPHQGGVDSPWLTTRDLRTVLPPSFYSADPRGTESEGDYWRSTFRNTILQPPDSGQAVSFHPRSSLPSHLGRQGEVSAAEPSQQRQPAHMAITPTMAEKQEDSDNTTAPTGSAGAIPSGSAPTAPTTAATLKELDASMPPSEADLLLASEVMARMQFWCLRGQPREACVLNPHYTVEGRQAEREAEVKTDETQIAMDVQKSTMEEPTPTRAAARCAAVHSESVPEHDKARHDQSHVSPAGINKKEKAVEEEEKQERTVTIPIKLLYSYVGTVCFQEETETGGRTDVIPPHPVATTLTHQQDVLHKVSRRRTDALGKVEKLRGESGEAESASLNMSSLSPSDQSAPSRASLRSDEDDNDDSGPLSDQYEEITSSLSSEGKLDKDDSSSLSEENDDDVPDVPFPVPPRNRRGQELLYTALQESNEVVVCALRECRPHRGYHDLWHVGNTTVGTGTAKGTRASLLKVADTLSDTEDDITEFDTSRDLGVDAFVRWAQGTMPPPPLSAPTTGQGREVTRGQTGEGDAPGELLFPRKTIGAHDRSQWQLERLRNEYRIARSSRVDALLVDSARGKVIAAITMEPVRARAESVPAGQRSGAGRPHRQGRHHSSTPLRGSATTASTATTHLKHRVMPSDSVLFEPSIPADPETNAATSTGHRLEGRTTFRVLSFTPYVSPLWRHIHRSKILLVDMDRTLVDNAITLSPTEQRCWVRNEQNRHAREAQTSDDAVEPTRLALQRMNLLTDFFDRTRQQQQAGRTFHYEERQIVTYFMTASPDDRCTTPDFHKPITELICVRPGVRQWLHRTAVQWGIPIILVTKSTRQRAEAIVRNVLDPHAVLFQRYDVQIVSSEQIAHAAAVASAGRAPSSSDANSTETRDAKDTSERHTPTTASTTTAALTEAKKSAMMVLRHVLGQDPTLFSNSMAAAPVHSASHTLGSLFPDGISPRADEQRRGRQHIDRFRPTTLARSVAILDDAPQVWEEADWPCTVLIAPYTLTRVDPRHYLSSDDGYLSSLTLSCLFSTRCLLCPQYLDRASGTRTRDAIRGFAAGVAPPRGSHCLCACPTSHRRRAVVVKRPRQLHKSVWRSPFITTAATAPVAATRGIAEEANSSSSDASTSLSRGGEEGEANVEDIPFPPRRARKGERTATASTPMTSAWAHMRVYDGDEDDAEDDDDTHTASTEPQLLRPAGLFSRSPRGSYHSRLFSIPREELNMSLEPTESNTPSQGHLSRAVPRADAHTVSGRITAEVPLTPNSFHLATPFAPFADDLVLTGGEVSRDDHGATSSMAEGPTPSPLPRGGTTVHDQHEWRAEQGQTSICTGVVDEDVNEFTPAMLSAARGPRVEGVSTNGPPAITVVPVSGATGHSTSRDDEAHRVDTNSAPRHSAWYTDDVEDVIPLSCVPASDSNENSGCDAVPGEAGSGLRMNEEVGIVEEPLADTGSYRRHRGGYGSDAEVEDVVPLP